MRLRNLLVSTTATLLVSAAVAALPAAAAPATHPEPWQPVEAGDFAVAAGRYCTFGFAAHITENQEQFRVDARYPDGAPRILEFRGKLLVTFTNSTTGKATLWDLSGYGVQEVYPDGATEKSFVGVGPFAIGFRATDNYPKGYYRLSGFHVVTITQDDVRNLTVDGGQEENLCQTVA
jgi:hypothetical protein